MNFKKGDNVVVLSGKDKGKRGKISQVISDSSRVVVEDVNLVAKRQKAKSAGTSGQVVKKPMPIDISNISLVCGKCDRGSRIGYLKDKSGKKVRICKKCKNSF